VITGAVLAVMMFSTFECVQIFYGNAGLELVYAVLGTIFFMGIFGVLLAAVGLVIKRTVSTASMIFGTVLLAIGLFASFYHVIHTVGQPPEAVILQIVYPFENVGIILLAAGVIFIALGLLHPPPKDNHIGIRIRETS
jgi:MFS superfamily sulfate permease-like transporter